MSLTPIPPAEKRRWGWLVLGGGLAVILAVGAGVCNLLTPAREARLLRRELFAAHGMLATKRIEGSAGPLVLSVVRLVTALISDIPPEVRDVVRSLESVSVGVYSLHYTPANKVRNGAFAAADDAMQRQGWIRALLINGARNNVVVYVPADAGGSEELRVCVAVYDDRRVFVVSGRARTDELIVIAQRYLPQLKLPLISGQGGHSGV